MKTSNEIKNRRKAASRGADCFCAGLKNLGPFSTPKNWILGIFTLQLIYSLNEVTKLIEAPGALSYCPGKNIADEVDSTLKQINSEFKSITRDLKRSRRRLSSSFHLKAI